MQLEKPSSPALKKPKIVKEGPQDVEMKEDEKKEIEEPKKDADLLTLEDIREQVKNIEKAVSSKEPRFITRALRSIVTLRRKLNNSVLRRSISAYFPGLPATPSALLEYLEPPKTDDVQKTHPRSSKYSLLPEVEIYLHLLLLVFLIDEKKYLDALSSINLVRPRNFRGSGS